MGDAACSSRGTSRRADRASCETASAGALRASDGVKRAPPLEPMDRGASAGAASRGFARLAPTLARCETTKATSRASASCGPWRRRRHQREQERRPLPRALARAPRREDCDCHAAKMQQEQPRRRLRAAGSTVESPWPRGAEPWRPGNGSGFFRQHLCAASEETAHVARPRRAQPKLVDTRTGCRPVNHVAPVAVWAADHAAIEARGRAAARIPADAAVTIGCIPLELGRTRLPGVAKLRERALRIAVALAGRDAPEALLAREWIEPRPLTRHGRGARDAARVDAPR